MEHSHDRACNSVSKAIGYVRLASSRTVMDDLENGCQIIVFSEP